MRGTARQILTAVFMMAVLIVVLERAGGFSLILERGSGAFAQAFGALTPAPRGANFTGSLLPRDSVRR